MKTTSFNFSQKEKNYYLQEIMGMRQLIFLAFFLSFFLPASALTAELDKDSFYSKGENMQITGFCSGKEIAIKATLAEKAIFSEPLECRNGRFELNYSIGFLDPRGKWEISIQNEEQSLVKKVSIKPTRESELFLINFLSPSAEKFSRTDDLNIAVKVTDAAKAVLNATVETWNSSTDGQRIRLTEQGDGIYSAKQSIPFNAPLGEWKITVVAQKTSENQLLGGETALTAMVEKAKIQINVLRPLVRSIEFGYPIQIEISATYSNKEQLQAGQAVIKVNEKEYEMEKDAALFKFSYTPTEQDLGAKTITVEAKDSAGNSATEEITVVISKNILFTAKENLLYIAVIIVLIAFALFFLYPKTKGREKKIELKSKKKVLTQKLQELQQEYFEKGAIPKKEYDKERAQFEEKLSEIEEKEKK